MAALTARAYFAHSQFNDTRFATSNDKAVALEQLARFIESGFKRTRFTKAVYTTLYQHLFGHIAHYDIHGFYDEWFSTPQAREQWVIHALHARPMGDPTFTWSDAETVFQKWLHEKFVT